MNRLNAYALYFVEFPLNDEISCYLTVPSNIPKFRKFAAEKLSREWMIFA